MEINDHSRTRGDSVDQQDGVHLRRGESGGSRSSARSLGIAGGLVFLLVLASGCAVPFKSKPSQRQMSKAIEGELFGPAPSDVKGLIEKHLRQSLKDPDSLRDHSVTEFMPGYYFVAGGLAVPEKLHWGWVGTTTYNAKNSYGGYVGKKLYRVLIRDQRVLLMIDTRTGGRMGVVEGYADSESP